MDDKDDVRWEADTAAAAAAGDDDAEEEERSEKLKANGNDGAAVGGVHRGSFAAVLFATILQAVDYGVVMPTAYLYILRLDRFAQEWLLGLTIAAFSFVGLVSAPFFGYWLDRRPMREVVVTQLLCAAGGMLIYALAPNVYVLILGRMVAGMSSSLWASSNLFVIRSTTKENRSSWMALVQSVTVLGLIAGPALNLPLAYIPRTRLFGYVTIDSLNAPGFLMALLNTIAIVMMMVLFQEHPRSEEEEDSDGDDDDDDDVEYGDNDVQSEPSATAQKSKGRCPALADLKPLLQLRVVALLIAQFIALFNQTTLEAVLAPVLASFYEFGPERTSLVYIGLTVELVVVFVLLGTVLTKRFADRVLLAVAWVMAGVAIAAVLTVLELAPGGVPQFAYFAPAISLVALPLPFYDVLVSSLFSKVVPEQKIQGRAQTLLGSLQGIAGVLGPSTSGALLTLGLRWVMVLQAVLWGLAFMVFVVAYRKLPRGNADEDDDVSRTVEQVVSSEWEEEEDSALETQKLLPLPNNAQSVQ